MKWILAIAVLSACSSNDFKGTKNVVVEGHKTLYHNGAFQFPYSTVKLIPPGPSAVDLALEMSGPKAKKSFLMALNRAKETYSIIERGSIQSYKTSAAAGKVWSQISEEIEKKSTSGSMWLIKKSSAAALGLTYMGHKIGATAAKEIYNAGDGILESFILASDKLENILSQSKQGTSAYLDEKSHLKTNYSNDMSEAMNDFVIGYAFLGESFAKRNEKFKELPQFDDFSKNVAEANKLRKEWSESSWKLISDSFVFYSDDVSKSFERANSELEKSDEYGVTFSLFKAIGHVLEGVIWQGSLKPAGKVLAGGVGYAFTNGVVYPSLLVAHSGKTSLEVAVEVVSYAGESSYEISAPSVKLALATLLASGKAIYEVTESGFYKAMKPASKLGFEAYSFVTTNTVKGLGHVGKYSAKYIAAPAAYLGGVTLGTGSGAVVGVGGVTTGAVLGGLGKTTGVLGKPGEYLVTKLGTTAGSIASTSYALGVGLYHVGQSVVVPSSYVLGSGIVLTYGTLSHIAAHSILALGDISYAVLSLEAGRWVLYGIKGKVDKNDYSQGTIVDLNKLQEAGEEIRAVELRDEEVEAIFLK